MKKYKFKSVRIGLCLGLSLGAAFTLDAQTPICGNITTATWTPAGNPYVVACDSTLLSGNTLTIQPGVIVWVGSNVTLRADGVIQAVGTPSQRITFQAPVSSQFWSSIYCVQTAGTHRFKYCDFKNANTALCFGEYYYNSPTMAPEVMT